MRFSLGKITIPLAGIIIGCSGCAKIQSASPEDGYNTDYAMSAVEYTIFLNKQISVASNILFTRMSMAGSVADSDYEAEKEIQSTQEAISKMEAVKDEVTVTMPAASLETDRQNILDLLEDSLNALNTYQEHLQNGELDKLDNSAIELKNCFTALSGEANTYYQ